MKIVMPEFVLPSLETRTCDLIDACDTVIITQEGEIQGDTAGAEVVMLPWALSDETYEALLSIPTLRWVHTITAGIDHALDALPSEHQITITNARGIFDVPIAEMVLTYMLVVVKRMREFMVQQEAHQWHQLRLGELADLTIGIIGMGNIGVEVARRCQALGMEIIATRKHPERGAAFVDVLFSPQQMSRLLRRAHFVVAAVPATPETRHLIGESALRQMRSDAWLINVARGAIVDQAALVRALREAWIAGAALDVFEEEPLPEDSPLWDLPNVIITPHNSWSTPRFKEREAELFLDNLERYLAGDPLLNVIDPALGY